MNCSPLELENMIIEVLSVTAEPFSIPQIERRLPPNVKADTFDVRDAVWRLIDQRLAKFTPKRYVTLS